MRSPAAAPSPQCLVRSLCLFVPTSVAGQRTLQLRLASSKHINQGPEKTFENLSLQHCRDSTSAPDLLNLSLASSATSATCPAFVLCAWPPPLNLPSWSPFHLEDWEGARPLQWRKSNVSSVQLSNGTCMPTANLVPLTLLTDGKLPTMSVISTKNALRLPRGAGANKRKSALQAASAPCPAQCLPSPSGRSKSLVLSKDLTTRRWTVQLTLGRKNRPLRDHCWLSNPNKSC